MAQVTRQKISGLTEVKELGSSDILYLSKHTNNNEYRSRKVTIQTLSDHIIDDIKEKDDLIFEKTISAPMISLKENKDVLSNFEGQNLINAQTFVNSSVNFIDVKQPTMDGITNSQHNKIPCLAIVSITIPQGTGIENPFEYKIRVNGVDVISEKYTYPIGTISKEIYLQKDQTISVDFGTQQNSTEYTVKCIPLMSKLAS